MLIIFISQGDRNFIFVIQAKMGKGKEGGFAIDDVTIDQKSCEGKYGCFGTIKILLHAY